MPSVDFKNERGQNIADPIYEKDSVNLRTLRRYISSGTAFIDTLNTNHINIDGVDINSIFIPITHTFQINDIFGLPSALSGKVGKTGDTMSGTLYGPTLDFNIVSGATFYSGSTELGSIFESYITNSETLIQNGLNTYTGGTIIRPTINVSALTINKLSVSGITLLNSLSANTISGNTFYSGSTPLEDFFYTRSQLQNSGESQVNFYNLTNVPSFGTFKYYTIDITNQTYIDLTGKSDGNLIYLTSSNSAETVINILNIASNFEVEFRPIDGLQINFLSGTGINTLQLETTPLLIESEEFVSFKETDNIIQKISCSQFNVDFESLNYIPSGTSNYIAKFDSNNIDIINSLAYDDGNNIGINTNSPNSTLTILGLSGSPKNLFNIINNISGQTLLSIYDNYTSDTKTLGTISVTSSINDFYNSNYKFININDGFKLQNTIGTIGDGQGSIILSVSSNIDFNLENTLLARINNQGRLGIGLLSSDTIDANLHVKGNFKLSDGTQGLGKVLTSDSGGTTSWQSIQTGNDFTGTTDYIAKFCGTTIANSSIYEDSQNINFTSGFTFNKNSNRLGLNNVNPIFGIDFLTNEGFAVRSSTNGYGSIQMFPYAPNHFYAEITTGGGENFILNPGFAFGGTNPTKVGIGTGTASTLFSTLQIKGSGITEGTSTLLLQNSLGQTNWDFKDNGNIYFSSNTFVKFLSNDNSSLFIGNSAGNSFSEGNIYNGNTTLGFYTVKLATAITQSVVIGSYAGAGLTDCGNNVIIGSNANSNIGTLVSSVIIGASAFYTGVEAGTIIGANSNATSCGESNIIGRQSSQTGGNVGIILGTASQLNNCGSSAIIIGSFINEINLASNTLSIGGNIAYGTQINDVFIGGGSRNNGSGSTAMTVTIQTTGVQEGNINTPAYNDFIIAGSKGTGNGVGGNVIFKVATPGSTGSNQNTLNSVLVISGNSNTNIDCVTNTGAFLPPRLTSNQATGLTAINGMIVYITDTNGVFINTGFWGYENSSWKKFQLM